MMKSTITETRRANLRAWIKVHGVPQAEKSYFGQLVGSASFGERAARRLEQDYKMGVGYLDRPIDESEPEEGRQLPELPGGTVLVRVDALELYLLNLFRECDDRGQESMIDAGEVSEKRSLTPIRRNKTK